MFVSLNVRNIILIHIKMISEETKIIDLNAPAWQLSTDKLVSLLERSKVSNQEVKSQPIKAKEKIKGIRGLAKFLDCGLNKAQELKDSGKFPVYYTGAKVFFFSDEVLEGIKDSK